MIIIIETREMNILLLPEIINTLSNQDLVGLDKIELWASLRTIKEMRVKMNKINKSNRNKNSMSSPFSPVMANLAASSSAGESTH